MSGISQKLIDSMMHSCLIGDRVMFFHSRNIDKSRYDMVILYLRHMGLVPVPVVYESVSLKKGEPVFLDCLKAVVARGNPTFHAVFVRGKSGDVRYYQVYCGEIRRLA